MFFGQFSLIFAPSPDPLQNANFIDIVVSASLTKDCLAKILGGIWGRLLRTSCCSVSGLLARRFFTKLCTRTRAKNPTQASARRICAQCTHEEVSQNIARKSLHNRNFPNLRTIRLGKDMRQPQRRMSLLLHTHTHPIPKGMSYEAEKNGI